MRKRPLFLFAAIFLAGMAHHRYRGVRELLLWKFSLGSLAGIAVLLGLFYELICGMKARNLKMATGRMLFLLVAFFLGCWKMDSAMEFRENYLSEIKDGGSYTIWGEVIKVEETSYGSMRLILSDCYIRLEEGNVACNDVLVYPSEELYQLGEIHKFTGKLNMFEEARNEGGFHSREFYQSQKIDLCMYASASEFLRESDMGIGLWLMEIREKLASVYEKYSSASVSGFLKGMLLGDKSDLEADLKTLFTNGGIAHILAISGLHVSIIGRGFYHFLRKRGFGFCEAGLAGTFLLLAYCFMIGSTMSAVRAVGMMLLFFLAQYIGRSYDMLNSLGFMVIVLLWENPFLLEYSGFWLSVMALLGVGYVGQVFSEVGQVCAEGGRGSAEVEKMSVEKGRVSAEVEKKVCVEGGRVSAEIEKKVSVEGGRVSAEVEKVSVAVGKVCTEVGKMSIGNSVGLGFFVKGLGVQMLPKFLMSVGTTLATLPIIAYCYYEIPLYAPLVNFLLLPVLTPIFICGLLGGLIGLVFQELTIFILWFGALGKWLTSILLLPCQWGLWLYEMVCSGIESLPFSLIITGKPSWEAIVLYYVLLFVGTFLFQKEMKKE